MEKLNAISIDSSIENLLLALNKKHASIGSGQVVVCDRNGTLVGVITDADVRRFLLSKKRLPEKIDEIVNKECISIEIGDSTEIHVRELEKNFKLRGWETHFPVEFVVLTQNSKPIRIQPISDFTKDIEKLRDNVIIFGLGFVGLTLGVFLAESGFNVIGIDSDHKKIDALKNGSAYLYEPGLKEALSKVYNINFFISGKIDEYMEEFPSRAGSRNIFFITVGTYLTSSNKVDFDGIDQVASMIAEYLKTDDLVLVRSTVPLGTTEKRVKRIIESKSGLVSGIDFALACAPERTIEGNALKELKELPQIVGGLSKNCTEKSKRIFENAGVRVVEVSSCTAAELIKLASNAYRDVSFAFSNEIARISIENSLSPHEIIDSANYSYDRNAIAKPSPGVGGPCLWKDSLILANSTKDPSFLQAARNVNIKIIDDWLEFILDQVSPAKSQKLSVLVIGVAFKGVPETNDTRNSSSVIIMEKLNRMQHDIEYWDYVLDELTEQNYSLEKNLTRFSKHTKAKFFNLVILANNHPKNRIKLLELFQNISFKQPTVVTDPWGLLTIEDRIMLGNRIRYFGIGLSGSNAQS